MLREFIVKFQSETSATVHLVYNAWVKAKKYFRTDIKYADTISTKVRLQMNVAWCKVKNKIEKQLDRYFSRETKQFLRVCRLLDPRNFKSTSKIQNYF